MRKLNRAAAQSSKKSNYRRLLSTTIKQKNQRNAHRKKPIPQRLTMRKGKIITTAPFDAPIMPLGAAQIKSNRITAFNRSVPATTAVTRFQQQHAPYLGARLPRLPLLDIGQLHVVRTLGDSWTTFSVPGDGHCMYACVQLALTNEISKSIRELRTVVADSILNPKYTKIWRNRVNSYLLTQRAPNSSMKEALLMFRDLVANTGLYGGAEEMAIMSGLYDFIPLILSPDKEQESSRCTAYHAFYAENPYAVADDVLAAKHRPKFLVFLWHNNHYSLVGDTANQRTSKGPYLASELPDSLVTKFLEECSILRTVFGS